MTMTADRRRWHRPADRASASGYLGNSPWLRTDLVRVGCWVAFGIVLNVVAWYGASGTTLWSRQTDWIVLGVLAAAVVAIGCAGWLVSGLRSVGAARAEVVRGLARPLVSVVAVPTSAELVAGPRMTRFHRNGCRLVAGKRYGAVGQAEIIDRQLQACGVCEP
jgi:hypothetical protein